VRISSASHLGLTIICAAVLSTVAFARAARSRAYVPDEIIVKFRPGGALVPQGPAGQATTSGQGVRLRSLRAARRWRVRKAEPLFRNFKKQRQRLQTILEKDSELLSAREKRILRRLKRAAKGIPVPQLDRIYRLKVELGPGQSIEQVLQQYTNDPDVEWAELNYIISAQAWPSDPCYPVQWALNNTGQMYPSSGRYNLPPGTPDADIDGFEAWGNSVPLSRVVVAVVDTGVDYTHEDLDEKMWINRQEIPGNGKDDDDNGYVDDVFGYDFVNGDAEPLDDNGHGTHVAGIIGAELDNGVDIAGVCPDANIMSLKVLDSTGFGKLTDAVEAFYYAVESGADIISNSWSGPYPSNSLRQAINYAYSQGVIVVAAAGNNGSDEPVYPAFEEHVISVAATNSNDERAPFSNFGDWVDIAAPGVDILSLASGRGAVVKSGTSMACPHVVGACALLLSIEPEHLGIEEVESALYASADPIAPGICSSGRLNASNALVSMFSLRGRLLTDREVYPCSVPIKLYLADPQLRGNGAAWVTTYTDDGDFEVWELTEVGYGTGLFYAEIPTVEANDPADNDGLVQVTNGSKVEITYHDADDGQGGPVDVVKMVGFDCRGPRVLSVSVDAVGPVPVVSLQTNEPASILVLAGLGCGGPYDIEANDANITRTHSVSLTGVLPDSNYYFVVEATDAVGNLTVADNNGLCYSFRANGPNDPIYVPTDYDTIQQAVDRSWPGGVVNILEGIYSGSGNRNIDFHGKDITVRGVGRVDRTVIDCADYGRAFTFQSGEGPGARLEGLTITGGNDDYAGIYCRASSPTIVNCILKNNQGNFSSAVYCNQGSEALIARCTIVDNYGAYAVVCRNGSDVMVVDSVIARNRGDGGEGGGILCEGANPSIINCTITANSAAVSGGALRCEFNSNPTVVNCILWDNLPSEISLVGSAASVAVTYSSVRGGWPGEGNVDADPRFLEPARGDYHLRWNPLCIDKGTNQVPGGVSEVDIEGNPRVLDGDWDGLQTVDMGAYEYVCSAIQRAINLSADGETIVVEPGLYRGNVNFEGKRLIVRSTDPNDPAVVAQTVIEGGISGSAVRFSDGEGPGSVLTGFTIRGADRGVYCYATSPAIRNCDLCDYEGIAVELWHRSAPEIADCNICGEIVTRPAIRNVDTGKEYDFFEPAVFDANEGDTLVVSPGISADALDFTGKNLTVRSEDPNNLAVVQSTVIDAGGAEAAVTYRGSEGPTCVLAGLTIANGSYGLSIPSSRPMITNCIIRDNLLAGVRPYRAAVPVFENCLISENQGDGFELERTAPRINNCTITANRTSGFRCNLAQPVITNSIVWGNGGPDGPEILLLDDFSDAIISYSDIRGGWYGTGNIDIEPVFVSSGYWADPNNPAVAAEPNLFAAILVAGDYRLLAASPCIDAGDPNRAADEEEKDLAGRPRVIGGRVDMGAFEFNSIPVADAGADQTAYAWIDGLAEVVLDGSGSYDGDGDALDYMWEWTVDGNTCTATGATPTIELDAGQYEIELVVSDGIDYSEPDSVVVTVEAPVRGRLWIFPRVLGVRRRNGIVLAWLTLPSRVRTEDVSNQKLELYPGAVTATTQYVIQTGRNRNVRTHVFAFFPADQVASALGAETKVVVSVVGRLHDGRYFFGSDRVRIRPGR